MADVIRKATNRFTKGLVMDFSPENTKNELLTNALNATLLTFNGNELSLQNDMGNGRVETAYLPDGYMPVGTCEYGGIIYIVSYNPLEDKSLIGCFPSPERNISNDELGMFDLAIERSNFLNLIQNSEGKYEPDPSGLIKHNTQCVILRNDKLNPGDKFLVGANASIYDEKLADLWIDKDPNHYNGKEHLDPNDFELVDNPIIALNIVSIEDSGKIIYLNSDVRTYEKINSFNIGDLPYTDVYKYHILGKKPDDSNQLALSDIDAYRDVLNSGYSVFKSKTSGKLAILAELIMIDSYSVTHSLQPKKDEVGDIIEGAFDIIIHTDVTPQLNKKNYNLIPKLKYYYLENSQGYLQIGPDSTGATMRTLFVVDEQTHKPTGTLNNAFSLTYLNEIYTPIDDSLKTPLEGKGVLDKLLYLVGSFNFPKSDSYHGKMTLYEDDLEEGIASHNVYTKFAERKMHRFNFKQIEKNISYFCDTLKAKIYYYDSLGVVSEKYDKEFIEDEYIYYIRKSTYEYINAERNPLYYKNPDYKLYKLDSDPLTATEVQIYDENIEKFLYQEVHTYKEATAADLLNESKLFYKDPTSNKYSLLVGSPKEGTTYYVVVLETNLVSIGWEIDMDTTKGTIYYFPGEKTYMPASEVEIEMYYDTKTYEKEPITLYYQKENYVYVEATERELNSYNSGDKSIELYYSTNYVLVSRLVIDNFYTSPISGKQLFITLPIETYVGDDVFEPSTTYNYILGHNTPNYLYPKDDPITVYVLADFIPNNLPENEDLTISDPKEYFTYKPLKLANIVLPSIVTENGLDLPFKYDYTLVPCMNYGKLLHLAISNTIDFSKLHAFNLSKFHTWKYRIDNNLLRLTFGVDVYDTYEDLKVDALILEFYDMWGFAGSLEIIDKKSYSGIFTKVIPLNSFKALSRNKIIQNSLTDNFKRNINMRESAENSNTVSIDGIDGTFSKFSEFEQFGWDIPNVHPKTKEELNDCGTLYSNVVYGVKAYFRRTGSDGLREFLKKGEYFLYTLPIYNDFYYTVLDFSNLTYPELEFVLTYKLKDNSTKSYYSENGIDEGFNSADKANIKDYLGGAYKETSLDVIKYYKYTGITDLYLEIGLNKKYEDLNMSYDPSINGKYKCKLRLYSDHDETSTFTINSGIEGLTGVNQILNYNEQINESVNQLKFVKNETDNVTSGTNILEIKDGLLNTLFITDIGTSPIKIKYEFIVGYTANIANIRHTLVQATTVCALFHKTPNGTYNYEDFGVYEKSEVDSAGNTITRLMSSTMFYNEGNAEKEVFGICRQRTVSGDMAALCTSVTSAETDAKVIKTAGKLNTPDALKQLVGNIGKLTFCQPHAHGLSTENGVNIHEGENTPHYYGIPPEEGGMEVKSEYEEDTYGITPRNYLFHYPKFNMSLNTPDSIKYLGSFLSTLEWKLLENKLVLFVNVNNEEDLRAWKTVEKMREYTGLTGEDLTIFNKKLLKTMSSVYAYNPDYDSLTVNAGNITLQDYNPNFTSNLVNTESLLVLDENETLNDYIYLGPVKYSHYLNKLVENSVSTLNDKKDLITIKDSEDKILKQLLFKENFDYCGTESNKYLISSLTYNTPVPKEIEQELEFNSSNIIVVKHTDGSNTFLNGSPNKKTLYGYHSAYDKMIQLDVSNYTIAEDGTLSLNDVAQEFKDTSSEIKAENSKILGNSGCDLTTTFTNSKNEVIDLKLLFGINKSGVTYLQTGADGFFAGAEYNNNPEGYTFVFKPYLNITNSGSNPSYTYNTEIHSINLEVQAIALNNEISLFGAPIALNLQSVEVLKTLVDGKNVSITLVDVYGTDKSYNECKSLWIGNDPFVTLWANDGGSTGNIALNESGEIKFKLEPNIDMNESKKIVLLFLFKVKSVNYTLYQNSKLEVTPETFIKTTVTSKYSTILDHAYTVDSSYTNALLRGSSITLNDLKYEPNPDGHRLFMKDNILCVYDPYLRGKLYYRSLDFKNDRETWHGEEDMSNRYINCLYFYTGPCYTSGNL